MPTLVVTVKTGFSNCTHTEEHDILDDVWASLDVYGREALIRECEEDSISNYISASTEVI